jgi:hypothetical protein
MNFAELLQTQRAMLSLVHAAYIQVYPDSGIAKIGLEMFKPDTERGINGYEFYSPEYNDSCSCHPEYDRDSFFLPAEIADSMCGASIVLYLTEKKARIEAEWKKKQMEDARKRIEDNDARERAVYENLKLKYGNK